MSTYNKYEIVTADCTKELEKKVNIKLKDGWAIQGRAFVVTFKQEFGNNIFFYQTMTKGLGQMSVIV